MKLKFFVVFIALAMVCAFSYNADAQTMMTTDVVLIRVGYIPMSTVTADEVTFEDGTVLDNDPDDLEHKGFAFNGEYNLNMSPVWIGIGLEYQYLEEDDDENIAQFIMPQANIKFITAAGFYVGAGLAGKYMMSYSYEGADPDVNDADYDKKIDLWANGIIGIIMPIGEGLFFNLEGRFGYNLTNSQYEDGEVDIIGLGKGDMETKTKSAYDIGIYAGIGFRAAYTGI